MRRRESTETRPHERGPGDRDGNDGDDDSSGDDDARRREACRDLYQRRVVEPVANLNRFLERCEVAERAEMPPASPPPDFKGDVESEPDSCDSYVDDSDGHDDRGVVRTRPLTRSMHRRMFKLTHRYITHPEVAPPEEIEAAARRLTTAARAEMGVELSERQARRLLERAYCVRLHKTGFVEDEHFERSRAASRLRAAESSSSARQFKKKVWFHDDEEVSDGEAQRYIDWAKKGGPRPECRPLLPRVFGDLMPAAAGRAPPPPPPAQPADAIAEGYRARCDRRIWANLNDRTREEMHRLLRLLGEPPLCIPPSYRAFSIIVRNYTGFDLTWRVYSHLHHDVHGRPPADRQPTERPPPLPRHSTTPPPSPPPSPPGRPAAAARPEMRRVVDYRGPLGLPFEPPPSTSRVKTEDAPVPPAVASAAAAAVAADDLGPRLRRVVLAELRAARTEHGRPPTREECRAILVDLRGEAGSDALIDALLAEEAVSQ